MIRKVLDTIDRFLRPDRLSVDAAREQLAAVNADLNRRLDAVIERLSKHDPGPEPVEKGSRP